MNRGSVIKESDTEFGVVTATTAVVSCDLPSAHTEDSKIAYFSSEQHAELLWLLDEFSNCFSNRPGLCDVVVHGIQTTNPVPQILPPGNQVSLCFFAVENNAKILSSIVSNI